MARPNNLSTKGEFNVIQVFPDLWELRFMNRVVVFRSSNRPWLYRQRAKYSSWFSIIVDLQHSLNKVVACRDDSQVMSAPIISNGV